jgi:hypothetical protein
MDSGVQVQEREPVQVLLVQVRLVLVQVLLVPVQVLVVLDD